MANDLHTTARRLGRLVEPLAAAIYFSPEAQERYDAFGLNYVEGYFCSRSASLGKAPWRLVTAVFGAFKPEVVERAVEGGWAKTDPDAMLDARLAGARDQARRLIGEQPVADLLRAAELLLDATDGVDPSGRALFSGLLGLEVPGEDDPYGRLWRAADRVREHRGDGHIAAWVPHVDSTEITLLSELWWGMTPGSYVWTRGYDADDVAAARGRLAARHLISGDGEDAALTPEGLQLRQDIEVATDLAAREPIRRLGDRVDELLVLLEPWSAAMVGKGGYPASASEMFA
ncbi:MAG TPA: hypothetical protein VK306_15875 [Acidimicrobiales bacterium]|nr:hypothetical protein [Acidimicrobiales bacterium]